MQNFISRFGPFIMYGLFVINFFAKSTNEGKMVACLFNIVLFLFCILVVLINKD